MMSMITTMASKIRIIGSPKVSRKASWNVVGSDSGMTFDPYLSREIRTCSSFNPAICMNCNTSS